MLDQAALAPALVAAIRADLRAAQRAQAEAQRAATHEESRPEHDKDTRATEASYLARGQARRVTELERELGLAQRFASDRQGAPAAPSPTVRLGSLVRLERDGGMSWVWLLPFGAGRRLAVGGASVVVVGAESPLGEALLGAAPGDRVELELGDRTVSQRVAAVR